MRNFKQLLVWQKSHKLVLLIYKASSKFPKEESFGITSQLRRAVVSIPCNIAEGCGRETAPDLARFLSIAMGSASETEYLILLSRDLEYLTDTEFMLLNDELIESKKMLNTLIRKIKS
ncbi:four helix bundle protein [Solitalea sp. MAHUQ-68]|uniref:Four helix bundle protein n=1 Tax=Solitalea agri TaxID=2953739 RepID=A0A9X2F3S0_9SPHI|nr:four helix bundle protein [Solitalea agri]MCO4291841.1 four helix bundle protein [Solitalea agri]